MQISRILLVACAAACATTPAVRGNDTPAQIKAREALRQKIQQSPPDIATPTSAAVSAAPATPAAAPVPAAPAPAADPEAIAKAREALREHLAQPAPPVAATPAPAAAPAPAPAPVAPAAAPAPSVAATADAPVPPVAAPVQHADPDAIAKAREAVRQRIEESPSTPPATHAVAPAPAVAASPAPAPVAPAPAQPKIVPPLAPATAAPAPAESDSIAKAREAVHQQMVSDSEVGPKADPEAIAKAREAVRQRMQSMSYAEPTSRGGTAVASNFVPLEGPPLEISSEKHDRLNSLLQRYKADQLTPEQYQAERAKILAGP